jgi:hypothetical protein
VSFRLNSCRSSFDCRSERAWSSRRRIKDKKATGSSSQRRPDSQLYKGLLFGPWTPSPVQHWGRCACVEACPCRTELSRPRYRHSITR